MHIKKENSALKMQIDDLKTKINVLQNTEFELKELKQSIGLKYSFSNYKYMEKVLGFDKSPYESFMIISKTSPITTTGKIVISSDGLVGIITNYNDKIAFVMTVCDQKLSIPAKTEKERLIISGIYKNKMKSKETKKNIESTKLNLSLGEILYTSGEGGFFPANIPIAKITEIHQDSNSISATPLSNIADVSYVWIISPVSD
jgi:rod shape-determining protein MreC